MPSLNRSAMVGREIWKERFSQKPGTSAKKLVKFRKKIQKRMKIDVQNCLFFCRHSIGTLLGFGLDSAWILLREGLEATGDGMQGIRTSDFEVISRSDFGASKRARLCQSLSLSLSESLSITQQLSLLSLFLKVLKM